MSPRARQIVLRLWARVQHDYMSPGLRAEWRELLDLLECDDECPAMPRRPMAGVTWSEIITM